MPWQGDLWGRSGPASLLLPLVHTSTSTTSSRGPFGDNAWAGLAERRVLLQAPLRPPRDPGVYAEHNYGHQGAKVALAKVSHSTWNYLSGLVDIQGITEDIRACGNCRSCRDTFLGNRRYKVCCRSEAPRILSIIVQPTRKSVKMNAFLDEGMVLIQLDSRIDEVECQTTSAVMPS